VDGGLAGARRAQLRLGRAQLDRGQRLAARFAHRLGQLLLQRGQPARALLRREVLALEHAPALEVDRDDALLLAEQRLGQLGSELRAAQLAHELQAPLEVGVGEVAGEEHLPGGLAVDEVAVEQRLGLARGAGREPAADLGHDAGADQLVGLLAGRGEEVVEEDERLAAGHEAAGGIEAQIAVDRGAGERGGERRKRRGGLGGRLRRRVHRRARRRSRVGQRDGRGQARAGERERQADAEREGGPRSRRAPPPHSPWFLSRLAWLRNTVLGLVSKIETRPKTWLISSTWFMK
jgi:hypothetical protein